jgi:hypothetical protein
MTRRRLRLAVAMLVALTWASHDTSTRAGMQQSRPPDVKVWQTGQGRIAGTVTGADTGRPIRDAEVEITSHGSGHSKTATTDADGRYEFVDLPAGEYGIRGSAARYLAREYASRISLDARGRFDRADLALPRLGAIGGRILDAFGDPVPGIGVFVFRRDMLEGLLRISAVPSPVPALPTDDLGRFRIYGLPPGEYYLGALSGALDASPAFNGRNDTSGFVPTFYPGTSSVSDARAIRLGVAQELDIALTLIPGRMSEVSGTVYTSTGQPLGRALVSIRPSVRSGVFVELGGRTQADQDGRFTLSGVPAGSYVLQAQSSGPAEKGTKEFAWQPLTLDGNDRTDLVVTTKPSSVLRLRVRFDAEEAAADPALQRRVVLPVAQPVDFDAIPMLGATRSAVIGVFDHVIVDVTPSGANAVAGDQTYDLTGFWGPRLVRLLRAPGWMLARVMIDGRDVTDTPIDPAGRRLEGEIVLRPGASIAGRVVGEGGSGVVAADVFVFSADRAHWIPYSRYRGLGRSDANGRFEVGGLPPGEYLVLARSPGMPGAWPDAAWLETHRAAAMAVFLAGGEARTADVRVVSQR